MSSLGKKLRKMACDHIGYFCPGCKRVHSITVCDDGWKWDGNIEFPTFSPSILVNGMGEYHTNHLPVCHSFVKNGYIQFLNDSTHELSGQTVEIPDWPFSNGEYGGIID